MSIFLCSIYVLCYQSFLYTNLVSGGGYCFYRVSEMLIIFTMFLGHFYLSHCELPLYVLCIFAYFSYGDRNVFSIFYRILKKYFRDINPDLQSKLSPLFHSLNFASRHFSTWMLIILRSQTYHPFVTSF